MVEFNAEKVAPKKCGFFVLEFENMRIRERRKIWIFFLVFGICLVALAIALQVGWIFLSLEQIALLVFGIIFFALIITGLILNMIFLVREIRRNEQHDAFINAVTHELKTPVASIKLYLETLKTREVSEEKRREFYDTMLSDTDRLNNTINLVLQAGRTGNLLKKAEFVEIDLNELLAEAVAIVKNRYNLENGEIKLEKNVVTTIKGDKNELRTAFVNLLDNAVKYSKQIVKINVTLENTAAKFVRIKIKDVGAGIPKAELNRIFRRFYRVSGNLSQTVKGTGLGLFIVQSVIAKHGGRIFAESDGENQGTTFTVKLRKKL